MKVRRSIAVMFLLLPVFVLAAEAQTNDVPGWQDARWGMNEAEIVGKFGEQLTKLPQSEKFAAAYVDYIISPYKISSGIYTVRFQMNNVTKKLDQVLIRLDQMDSLIPNEMYFNQLDSLLTEKYGSPKWKNDQRKSGGDLKLERKWVFTTTTIELTYSWMNIGKGFNLLTIRYFPTKKSEAEKV